MSETHRLPKFINPLSYGSSQLLTKQEQNAQKIIGTFRTVWDHMVLKISSHHLDEIFQHAEKCYPVEACGILVGKVEGEERTVIKVYHTKNVIASSSSYQIDPVEQLRVFEEAELNGLDVLGFYHSHPFWDPFWSEADEEASKLWTGYVFLIVSLKTGTANAYIRRRNELEKIDIVIL